MRLSVVRVNNLEAVGALAVYFEYVFGMTACEYLRDVANMKVILCAIDFSVASPRMRLAQASDAHSSRVELLKLPTLDRRSQARERSDFDNDGFTAEAKGSRRREVNRREAQLTANLATFPFGLCRLPSCREWSVCLVCPHER